jgi:hypothetical protein
MADYISVNVFQDNVQSEISQDAIEILMSQSNGVWVRRSGDSMSGTLNMTGSKISEVGSVLFNLLNVLSPGEGEINWNSDDGTLQVGMPGGEVVMQLGQENTFIAKNISGDEIGNGTPIVITGATGIRPEVDVAATTPQATSGSIGIATQDIGNQQNGYITTFGLVRDVDTSDFAKGARLFLSDTPGELSASLPALGSRKTFIGIVINANVNEGQIFLSPINIFFLDELSGMNINNPQDGDVLTYHAASGTWINQQP